MELPDATNKDDARTTLKALGIMGSPKMASGEKLG